MKRFILSLALPLLCLSVRGASSGDKVYTLSGTSPSINWNLSSIYKWTLSGNSSPAFLNTPTSTNNEWSVKVYIVQPVGQNYTLADISGISWQTTKWSALPSGSTNTIIFRWNTVSIKGWWVEAPSTTIANPVPATAGYRYVFDGTTPRWIGPFDFFYNQGFTGATSGEMTSGTANSGVSAPGTGDGTHPGIWSLSTSTSTNASARYNSAGSSFLFNGLTWEWFGRVNIGALSTSSENYIFRMGFGNGAGTESTEGVYFQHDVTTANWILKTSDNGVRTSTTSSTAVTTGWNDYRIVVNSAGTLATYYILSGGVWVSIGTNTTNIPVTAGRPSGWTFQVIKAGGSVGTTPNIFLLDQVTVVGY